MQITQFYFPRPPRRILLLLASFLIDIVNGLVSVISGKSRVFFSRTSQPQVCRMVIQILNMKGLKPDADYLGAPLFLSKAPTKDFKYLQDRLDARLMGWRSKCLSWAGRSTLIKSIAQAMPTYAMSSFNIPTKICDKLDALARRF